MSDLEVLLQQLIIGLSNGMIIALIALGYTMVYGIVELINFAHGDLFMLGAFLALTCVGISIDSLPMNALALVPFLFIITALFCGSLNLVIERFIYKPLRNTPKLVPLVSAVGVSFILVNFGLFWGGAPLKIFNYGNSAASPKDFPSLLPDINLLGDNALLFAPRDLLVYVVTFPLLLSLTFLVKYTPLGRAMRAVAQNPTAAKLMGIDVDSVISKTFFIGGALAGMASVVYSLYNNTVFFQMGYRVGLDAFTAAVLGGIGHLGGAVLGGIVLGILRAMSDQYLAPEWTNSVVFLVLILVLVFKPSGILGRNVREKV